MPYRALTTLTREDVNPRSADKHMPDDVSVLQIRASEVARIPASRAWDPHVLSAAASVYDEIRRAECLIGPAQIDRCLLLMSAPNEPSACCLTSAMDHGG